MRVSLGKVQDDLCFRLLLGHRCELGDPRCDRLASLRRRLCRIRLDVNRFCHEMTTPGADSMDRRRGVESETDEAESVEDR